MSFVKTPDANLYYELAGKGPPVLFIQGVGAAGEAWRPQVTALQNNFQTLLYDNRGLGQSLPCSGPITIEAMVQDARALLDAAGWDSAHIIGHSMGGVIAQQLALDCPKRVRSLGLLCTFPRGKDAARLTLRVLWLSLRVRIGSRSMRRHAFLDMLMPKDHLKTVDLDTLAAQMAKLIGRDLADSPPILMQQLRALGRHDSSRQLQRLVGIPTLVLSAEHDPIAPPHYGHRLAGLIPGARFEQIPATAHGFPIQQPDQTNQRLQRFLTISDTDYLASH
ncbi:MAG: putative hydrolase [Pedosphaera sp.]|nr:putative hydrolase [Pedosphaera sp.]